MFSDLFHPRFQLVALRIFANVRGVKKSESGKRNRRTDIKLLLPFVSFKENLLSRKRGKSLIGRIYLSQVSRSVGLLLCKKRPTACLTLLKITDQYFFLKTIFVSSSI